MKFHGLFMPPMQVVMYYKQSQIDTFKKEKMGH